MTKTLIIATGRCGSSALARAIVEEFDYNFYDDFYDEPFNPYLNTTNEITGIREFDETKDKSYNFTAPWKDVPPNTIWKCLLSLDNYPEEYKDIADFFLDFSKSFDNVILLSRRNHGERLYSLLHAIKHDSWHVKEERHKSKHVILNEDDYQTINDFVYQIETIKFLSKAIDKEIFYYEDLFTDLETSEKTWNKIVGRVDDYESIYQKWLNPIYKDRIGVKPGFTHPMRWRFHYSLTQ